MKKKTLIIVESPAKSNTISKYLGKEFLVSSSMGHVRDLNPHILSIDVNNNYRPHYEELKDKKQIIKELKQLAKKSERVLLAPDPDREGEAIAFHLQELLKKENQQIFRIFFNEITKNAVLSAIETPTRINDHKVNSQQMRRLLDRLAGYKISPVLQKKIGGPLSAGRVQSIALKLIVEREKEISAFVPEEYWTITADFLGSSAPGFSARLEKYAGKKLTISNQEQAEKILSDLKENDNVLSRIKKRVRYPKPLPPLITSTLQQEAFKKFKFPVKKTMRVAQTLYEGVNIQDEGQTGLITYMRTDSYRIAQTAAQAAADFVSQSFGKDFLPEKPNSFVRKANTQDAHEAIRPSLPLKAPETIKSFLSPDQFKIYKLIWERFIASQMKPATIEVTTFEISNGKYLYIVKGEVVKFPGHLSCYGQESSSTVLPSLKEKEVLEIKAVNPKQNFTKPPARYTEASLVKILEDKGIGRPSTYAKIIDTLGKRDYILRRERKFFPTLLGEKVVEYLDQNFSDMMNYNFTAEMEKKLDLVSQGKLDWVAGIDKFYKQLMIDLDKVKESEKVELFVGRKCPKCGEELVKKYSHRTNGWFIGCSGYPNCTHTEKMTDAAPAPKDEVLEKKCPQCGSPLIKRYSRKTRQYFIGCSAYPQCNHIEAADEQLGNCPLCEKPLRKRYSRKTRQYFIGCSGYPDCTYIRKEAKKKPDREEKNEN